MTTKMFMRTAIMLVALLPLSAMAQTDRDYIRSGNKSYRQKKYSAAEVDYRKALSLNPENPQALYNMGCALMMQNKASEAVKQYQKASNVETNKKRRAKIFHNIGVICQSGKMYAEAIKAYCEALRNNPSDNETRYNLALCKKLLKNNKNNNQKQNQNNKNDKQNGKDKQQNQKDKQGKNDDKNKQNQNKQNQQQPEMSKDNAEQLLNAAMQQEQQTQERLNKNRQQNRSKHLDKNW